MFKELLDPSRFTEKKAIRMMKDCGFAIAIS